MKWQMKTSFSSYRHFIKVYNKCCFTEEDSVRDGLFKLNKGLKYIFKLLFSYLEQYSELLVLSPAFIQAFYVSRA